MFRLLCLAIVILGHPAPAAAQATGSIAGLVTDQSAAVLPGVTVEARNAATGQMRNTVTGPDGFYTLPFTQQSSTTYSHGPQCAGGTPIAGVPIPKYNGPAPAP